MFSVYSSHLWARDNPYEIRERGYKTCFCPSVWVRTVADIVVGTYLLPDRLTALCYLETVLLGLQMYLRLPGRGFGLCATLPTYCGEDVRQWLNAICPRRLIGRRGPVAWPPPSLDLIPMDFSCRDT
jgi:hypothetical protein